MKTVPRTPGRLGLVVAACLALAVALPALSPRAAAQGSGAVGVPITFDDYHGYTGATDYMKKVAAAYPEITELVEIGRSTMGRPIHVLIITNRATGTTLDAHVALRNPRAENVKNVTPMKRHQGKPGQWIDGGTHGNEQTGSEVCLYIIDKLVSGYGSNAEIKTLVDGNTFYICPVVNPDGVYNSVEAGISQRQNSALEDDDEDGKVNEDGPDDLDGDGVISQFRYKDPDGRFYISDVDPRVMVRLGPNETTTRERYSVIVEDKDNDGDGKRGEDPERGIDVNRNFPEGWYRDDLTQGGSGAYPSSSPEAHAILEFFTNHTNILMVQSFHTSGGFTYRPFARWPDSRIDPKDLAVFDNVMGEKYLELIGEKPAKPVTTEAEPASEDGEEALSYQAQRPGQPQGAQRAAAAQQRQGAAPAHARGWRPPYNHERNTAYGFGIFMDWAYGQFGSWAMSTELWNWQRDTRGLPGYAGEDDRVKWEIAFIDWQQKALGGRGFVPWKRFTHPELGAGEVGGFVSRYSSGNAPPGDSLRGVCETHWQFELFKAKLLPKLEITDAKAKLLYTSNSAGTAKATAQDGDVVTVRKAGGGKYRIVQVTATVVNDGALATHIARGARLRGNRDDVIWLIGDRDKVKFLQGTPWMRLGTIDGAMPIPGYEPRAEPAATVTGPAGRPGAPQPAPGVPQFVRQQRPETPEAQSGNRREITWLVAIEGDSPLKLVLTSQKGGTRVKDVVID
jgi:hypothetical protein